MIPDNKEDGYIYYIFLAPRESETAVLRYRIKHLQEPLQKPNHIQLMELRAKTIRWKIRLLVSMLWEILVSSNSGYALSKYFLAFSGSTSTKKELSIIKVLLKVSMLGFKLPTFLNILNTIMTTSQGMRKEMTRLNHCRSEFGGMLEIVVESNSDLVEVPWLK